MILLAAFAVIMSCAFIVAVKRGFAPMSVFVWIPVMLYLSTLRSIDLPKIPDLNAFSAVGYPFLAVLAFRATDFRKLRFNSIDALMIAILGWECLSLIATQSFWDAVSAGGIKFFIWLMPYAFGRLVMRDADARRGLFWMVTVSAIVIGFLAIVEARLAPYIVSRAVEKIGLVEIDNTMVMYRYGFARAQVLTPHPIDLGNVGVLLGALILVLCPMLGTTWRKPFPLLGLGGAGLMVFGGMSFTCFSALAAAFVFYFAFSIRGLGKRLVMPALISIIIALVAVTSVLISRQISDDAEGVDGAADASLWMRTKIVQGSWRVAQTAGFFGYNDKFPGERIGTGSIDNAYMLFIMSRGWPYLFLWIALAAAMAWRGSVALGRARTAEERQPVAAALAGLLAMLVAMYTVWYGFIYAQLFVFLLGMLSSMTQMFEERSLMPVLAESALADRPFFRRAQAVGGAF